MSSTIEKPYRASAYQKTWPMDILKTLRELNNEKKRLDAAIAALEARKKAGYLNAREKPVQSRRGRKSMSPAERLEVSKRMTLYWESRRAQVGSATLASGDGRSNGTSAAS
jgi:hypothetical protein